MSVVFQPEELRTYTKPLELCIYSNLKDGRTAEYPRLLVYDSSNRTVAVNSYMGGSSFSTIPAEELIEFSDKIKELQNASK